jgi:DNA-binding beta-propeller fold protein YncE
VDTVGTADAGLADGAFDKASFFRPQGLALAGDSLYVADTENHLIRRVDLKTRTVETVAGTGKQTHDYPPRGGPAGSTALSSPWDLQLIGRSLYIAMAGPHQIWKLDLDSNQVSIFAGSGREARLDGSLSESGFAQPSGIAAIENTLYVADSESNIIRAIDIAGGTVKTLVGGDLFDFGDVDALGDEVRLQHPLGIVPFGDKLLIADTYNHKIKELDPKAEKVTTLFGTGKSGQSDGPTASFYEPGGLTLANGNLYIADTNNHAIRVVDLKTKRASTLRINGLMPPVKNMQALETAIGPNAEEIKVAAQKLRVGANGALQIDVELPAGYHLNPLAPQRYKVSVDGKNLTVDEKSAARASKDLKLPVRVPLNATAAGSATVRAQVTLFYCREDNTGTCRIKTLVWQLPVEVTSDPNAPTDVKLKGKLDAD